jgi:hypothetical protein
MKKLTWAVLIATRGQARRLQGRNRQPQQGAATKTTAVEQTKRISGADRAELAEAQRALQLLGRLLYSSNVSVSASKSNQQSRSVSFGFRPCRWMQCSRNSRRHLSQLTLAETGERRAPITVSASTANVSFCGRSRFGHNGTSDRSDTRRACVLCRISEKCP